VVARDPSIVDEGGAAVFRAVSFLTIAVSLVMANAVQARTHDTHDTLDVNGAHFKVDRFRFGKQALHLTLAGVKSATVLTTGALFKNVYLEVPHGNGKELYTLVAVTVGSVATSHTGTTRATLDFEGLGERYLKANVNSAPPKLNGAANAANSGATSAQGAHTKPTPRPSNKPGPGSGQHSQN
jgi:hypothetical protein